MGTHTVRPGCEEPGIRLTTVVEMRRILLVVPAILLVASCTTDSSDFKGQTEDFINDNTAVENLFEGADVSNASCEAPASTDVGSEYVCTAEVEGLGTVTFNGLIDQENSFSVTPAP